MDDDHGVGGQYAGKGGSSDVGAAMLACEAADWHAGKRGCSKASAACRMSTSQESQLGTAGAEADKGATPAEAADVASQEQQ